MADISAIPQISPFVPDADPTSVAQRWKRWSDRFDNLIVAMNVTDNKRKRALLLHLAGEAVFDVFEGLVVATIPDDADPNEINAYTVTKQALDSHFNPKKNVEFERYTFRTAIQLPNENIDSYHARLRSLAKYCDFADIGAEIKSHIIQTCKSTRLRRRALTDTSLTLQTLVDFGRSIELSEKQTKTIEGRATDDPVNSTVGDPSIAMIRQNQRGGGRGDVQHARDFRRPSSVCRYCGQNYPHDGGRQSCPAWMKVCRACGKSNHFESQCLSTTINHRQASPTSGRTPYNTNYHPPSSRVQPTNRSHQHVRQVRDDVNTNEPEINADESDEYVFRIGATSGHGTTQPRIDVIIEGTVMNLILDTGASVNILDESAFKSLKNKPKLNRQNAKIYAYGCHPISILGKFDTAIESANRSTHATVFVTSGENGSLLSFKTANELGLITINTEVQYEQSNMQPRNMFSEILPNNNNGKRYYVDYDEKPVAQRNCRVPFRRSTQAAPNIKFDTDSAMLSAVGLESIEQET